MILNRTTKFEIAKHDNELEISRNFVTGHLGILNSGGIRSHTGGYICSKERLCKNARLIETLSACCNMMQCNYVF